MHKKQELSELSFFRCIFSEKYQYPVKKKSLEEKRASHLSRLRKWQKSQVALGLKENIVGKNRANPVFERVAIYPEQCK